MRRGRSLKSHRGIPRGRSHWRSTFKKVLEIDGEERTRPRWTSCTRQQRIGFNSWKAAWDAMKIMKEIAYSSLKTWPSDSFRLGSDPDVGGWHGVRRLEACT